MHTHSSTSTICFEASPAKGVQQEGGPPGWLLSQLNVTRVQAWVPGPLHAPLHTLQPSGLRPNAWAAFP